MTQQHKKQTHKDNIFGCIYGPPKTGKTTALLRGVGFPSLFIAPRGSLNCANWLGIEPKHIVPTSLEHVCSLIDQTHNKLDTIVIDDVSILFEQEQMKLLKECRGNVWDSYARLIPKVLAFRDVCRSANCNVWWSMHEQGPREEKDLKGGPLVPGVRLPKVIPTMFDFVARVVYDGNQPGHPYVFQLGPDPDWVTGWRGFEGPPTCRVNLGEFLRACGHAVPRNPKLEWMEKEVESLAGKIYKRSQEEESFVVGDLFKATITKLEKENKDQRHIRTVCMDALDRASMRKYTTNTLELFIDNFEQEITL